ncbi:MAG: coproporphyrinogen III oxidase family protein [Lentisphaerae bacterium]|nr:MAG: coproporphyrinogen III oxidase family protein [Lentisphaerota bacterium]
MTTQGMTELLPSGFMPSHLYVHVPFCRKRCDYCAFFSTTFLERIDEYLDHLEAEIRFWREYLRPLETLYIGGGTPNVLSPAQLERFMNILKLLPGFTDDYEFSMEWNPLFHTREKLAIVIEGGLNRLSVGVQRFDNRLRQAIGRAGTSVHVRNALSDIEQILKPKPDVVLNCDLIYALPDDNLYLWKQDLHTVMSFGPAHLSCYELSVEPGTALAQRNPEKLAEDDLVAFWQATDEILAQYGTLRYEISNFARPHSRCRHNMAVWYGTPFLGLGPSAGWFDGVTRWSNPADFQEWLIGTPPTPDRVDAKIRAREILLMGLRIVDGWSPELFRERTGFDLFELAGDVILRLQDEGLLRQREDGGICTTAEGLLLHDYLSVELLSYEESE